jgi:hypothetical protein
MLTYLATFRLRCVASGDEWKSARRCPTVAVRIRDFCLRHAAARAEWRLPVIASEQGWHPGRVELVAVELMVEQQTRVSPVRNVTALARDLSGCDIEARRLEAAAAVVAGVDR